MRKTFQNNNNSNNFNIKNNKNSINNINNNTKPNGITQACAACKYQRRKCASDCLLAPYFPHYLHHQFLNAHKLFGVSNITKIIRPLPQPQRDQAMESIKYESDVRAKDPVGGSARIICHLNSLINDAYTELNMVKQQLAVYRNATADTVPLMCDPDPQSQAQPVEPESEDVIIHCDNIINNDAEDHESNAYKAVDEPISHILHHMQPQCQVEDDDGATTKLDDIFNNNIEDQLYRHASQNLDEHIGKEDVRIDNNGVTPKCDSVINKNVEGQLYQHDSQNFDENNGKEDVRIEQYLLEGDNNGVTTKRDSVVNNNIEDPFYRHDPRNSDENNGKEDMGIEQYLLEGDNEITEENNNVVLSWPDIEASWAMQDAWTYFLNDKDGFANECGDLKPNIVDNIDGQSLGPKYCNDELTILEPSAESILKDNKANSLEKTVSCISREDRFGGKILKIMIIEEQLHCELQLKYLNT